MLARLALFIEIDMITIEILFVESAHLDDLYEYMMRHGGTVRPYTDFSSANTAFYYVFGRPHGAICGVCLLWNKEGWERGQEQLPYGRRISLEARDKRVGFDTVSST